MRKIAISGLLVLAVALSVGAFATPAGAAGPTTTIPTGITTAAGFVAIIKVITDWIFVILLLVAVIFIVLAGFQFITGGGDPAQISGARTKLIYAAVGIAVAVLARGVGPAVRDIIGT